MTIQTVLSALKDVVKWKTQSANRWELYYESLKGMIGCNYGHRCGFGRVKYGCYGRRKGYFSLLRLCVMPLLILDGIEDVI